MASITFEFNGNKYPISIDYFESLKVLPDKFDIHLNKIFTNTEAASKTMEALVLDDERTLKLAWYYLEPSASFDEDTFLRTCSGKDLERFREAFWQAVVGFSGPLKRNLLEALWDQFKRDLKATDLQSMKETSTP